MSRKDYDRGYAEMQARIRSGFSIPSPQVEPEPKIEPDPGQVWDWYADAIMERTATEHERATAAQDGIPPWEQEMAKRHVTKPVPAPDPVAEILTVLSEPLGIAPWDLDELANYTAVPAGACNICHLGPVSGKTGMCLYCRSLHQLRLKAATVKVAADTGRVPVIAPPKFRCTCRECGLLRRVTNRSLVAILALVWIFNALWFVLGGWGVR